MIINSNPMEIKLDTKGEIDLNVMNKIGLNPVEDMAGDGIAPAKSVEHSEVSPAGNKMRAKTEEEAAAFTAQMLMASNKAELPQSRQYPVSPKPVVSLNTAAMIAGPKPWTKDWVFQGGEEMNPEMKPLFADSIGQKIKTRPQSEKLDLQPKLQSEGSEVAAQLGLEGVVVPREPVENLRVMDTIKQPKIAKGQDPKSPTQPQQGEGEGVEHQLKPEVKTVSNWTPTLIQGGAIPLNSKQTEKWVEPEILPAETRGEEHFSEPMKKVTHAPLSGGEFLSTLSLVKGAGKEQPLSMQAIPDAQGGGIPMDSPRQLSPRLEGKPVELDQIQEPRGSLDTLKRAKSQPRNLGHVGVETNAATVAGLPVASRLSESPQVESVPREITGHVTQNGATRNRLSSESILGVTTGIREMSQQGGGEMRLRLKPDNLGEVHVRVTTRGNEVTLKIQASDDQAKKVLEESMSHLKSSMASHNLNLGAVDLSVSQSGQAGIAGQNSTSSESGLNQQQQGQTLTHEQNAWHAQQGFDQTGGRGRNQQEHLSNLADQDEDPRVARGSKLATIAAASRMNSASQGRLNVIA